MFHAVTDSDFDLVYSIYTEDAIIPYMSFEKVSKEAFKECFQQMKYRDKFLCFKEHGQVVGLVTVIRGKWRKSHVATIGGLAVPSPHQGKGVATRMIKSLVESLAEQGIRRFELFVESDNTNAINLYKKLGFKQEGILKGYFKRDAASTAIDEIIMARII